jgi:hypothetical protein
MAPDGQPLTRDEHEAWMRRIWRNVISGSLTAAFFMAAVAATPAAAGFLCRNNQACGRADPIVTSELTAQTKRPRVTIYRRRIYPGPNAVRQCHSWLVTEYRISGPVIVPQMYCWWE